ncbi:MAG: hypothetical protein P0116_14480 [Candidatus Nitrosocosmicus sp.]|nr:hypothetical protein [Candidatus Nitrosocosmicus sp.]
MKYLFFLSLLFTVLVVSNVMNYQLIFSFYNGYLNGGSKTFTYNNDQNSASNKFVPFDNFAFTPAGYSPSNNSQNQLEIGVWLYVHCYYDLDYGKVDEFLSRNINTIYFSVQNDDDCGGWDDPALFQKYADFIEFARSQGMNVYAVTLEKPYYIKQNYDELEDSFGSFINKTKEIFDTYVIDVEPYDIEGGADPDAGPNVYVPEYIEMSKNLRSIADQYGVKYIDTVPDWLHTDLKNIGLEDGLDALYGDEVNIMTYYPTAEQVLDKIKDIRTEVIKPYVVSIKITEGLDAPTLQENEINKTINLLRTLSIPIGLFEADGIVQLPFSFFQ